MKIYTKGGDKGKTSLASGRRVKKNDLRIKAYGTVDELNSLLGVIISTLENEKLSKLLKKIQNDLFEMGSDLSTPLNENKYGVKRISEIFIEFLEKVIDYYDSKNQPLHNFILPGGSLSSSLLQLARTVCRRAEREVVELMQIEEINENVLVYLNRLSDLLFVLARFANKIDFTEEIPWERETSFNLEDYI
jgi:cob(I)alamin adenosyltransferase